MFSFFNKTKEENIQEAVALAEWKKKYKSDDTVVWKYLLTLIRYYTSSRFFSSSFT